MTKEDVIERINTHTDWYPKSYAGGLFGIYIQAMGLSQGAKEIPCAMKYGLVYQNRNQKNHWDWFWDVSEMRDKRALLLAETSKGKTFTDSFFAEWEKRYTIYVTTFESLAEHNLSALSQDELFEHSKKLYDACVAQAAYGYVVDALLTNDAEDWLEEVIKEELGEKATPQVIALLTAPANNSFVGEYEIALLELAEEIKKGAEKDVLYEHARRLERSNFWQNTNYLDYTRVTAEHIYEDALKRSRDIADISALLTQKKEQPNRNRKIREDLFAELNVSERLQNILHLSETFSYIQDKRKECVLRNNTLFYEVLSLLSEKNGFDDILVFYLTPAEFFSFLEKGVVPDWKQVRWRFEEGVLVLYFEGTSSLMHKDEIDSSVNTKHLFPDLDSVTELKGAIAYSGTVQGVVRVLHNTKEIATFQEGEVLVANQTTPEFVTAMKKAVAIITDQGGITCHAAIVARELKKPCIIGAKNATNILKDGDMVEVDAKKGVVTVLQK